MTVTKIELVCDGIIEMGWLGALVLVPVFVDSYFGPIFEPEKVSVIRAISLVMLAAWMIKFVVGGRLNVPTGLEMHSVRDESRAPDGLGCNLKYIVRTPLVLPVLLITISYVLSSILSISPRISWWGSYYRAQGAVTTFAYISIFGLMLLHLRTMAQWRRLAFAVVITGTSIAVLATLQHFGVDPFPRAYRPDNRVAANLGNPVFLGAYLIMVVFVTVERLAATLFDILRKPARPNVARRCAVRWSLAVVFALALTLQIIGILFSGSRGPLLGLLAGAFVYVLLGLLLLRGDRRLKSGGVGRWRCMDWLWVMPIAAGLGVLLFFLGARGSLPQGWQDHPATGRLTTALDPLTSGAQGRAFMWAGAIEIASPHSPFRYLDGSLDRFNSLRPLVGHGPETMRLTYSRFYPLALGEIEGSDRIPDRAHNELLDKLGTLGLFGFLAHFALFASVLRWGFHWLGLSGTGSRCLPVWGVLLTSALLGALLTCIASNSLVFAVPGLSVGLLGGFVFSSVFCSLRVAPGEKPSVAGRGRRGIVLATLTGLIAHFVADQFGFGVTATRTYFWVYAAVLVVAGEGWLHHKVPPPTGAPRGRNVSFVLGGCLVTVILAGTAIHSASLVPLWALAYANEAWVSFAARDYEQSLTSLARALELDPRQDFYWSFQGSIELARARSASTLDDRDAGLARAAMAFQRSQSLSPLDPGHAEELANLYQYWGGLTGDLATAKARLRQALRHWEFAARLKPRSAVVLNKCGWAHQLLGKNAEAIELYQRSQTLAPEFVQTYLLLGNLHRKEADEAFVLGNGSEASRHNAAATDAYEAALLLAPNLLAARLGLAEVQAAVSGTTELGTHPRPRDNAPPVSAPPPSLGTPW